MVQLLAESRVKGEGMQLGRACKREMGVLVGQVRRLLSVAALSAEAGCLLSS